MGVGIKFSDVSSTPCTAQTRTAPNPNKFNFVIVREYQAANCCVLMVEYSDCSESERCKILVLGSTTYYYQVVRELDPHFVNGDLIARFRGNEHGWNLATKFADTVSLS